MQARRGPDSPLREVGTTCVLRAYVPAYSGAVRRSCRIEDPVQAIGDPAQRNQDDHHNRADDRLQWVPIQARARMPYLEVRNLVGGDILYRRMTGRTSACRAGWHYLAASRARERGLKERRRFAHVDLVQGRTAVGALEVIVEGDQLTTRRSSRDRIRGDRSSGSVRFVHHVTKPT